MAHCVAEIVAEHHDNNYVGYFLQDALKSWATASPENALEWLRDQQDLGDTTEFIATVFETWSTTDPSAAIESVKLFDQGSSERSSAYNATFSRWAMKDAMQAASWFNENVEPQDIPQLNDSVSDLGKGLLRQNSGEEALAWIETIESDDVQRSSIETLTFVWATVDQSAKVLDSLFDRVDASDEFYQEQLCTATENLALHDPVKVAEWLCDESTGKMREAPDKVIQGFASAMCHLIPDIAYDWTTTIQDENLRYEAGASIVSEWSISDPVGYKIWLIENQYTIPVEVLSLIDHPEE